MAKEYKFMFDRRFDEPENENTGCDQNDSSALLSDGIPSISQLLDTIDGQTSNERFFPLKKIKKTPDQQKPSANQPSFTSSGEELKVSIQNVKENLNKIKEPVFTKKDLDDAIQKAKTEGYQQGFQEGRDNAWKEAVSSIEKQNSDTLSLINVSLKEILDRTEETARTAYSTALNTAIAVCKKIAPALSEKNALTEIEFLIRKNFHFLKDEPKISIRITPALADKIKPALSGLIKKESYGGKIAIIRDESIRPGDCRIEWKNGGLQRNIQDILSQSEELIHSYALNVLNLEPDQQKIGEQKHG